MITLNRIRHRFVHAKAAHDSRRAVAFANRVKARTLRNPVFLAVMALAVLVLLVDIPDGWPRVASFILALGEWARSGA